MEQNERFDLIYSETRDDLLRYLMLRTNGAPEAEDLFQEVYRRFYVRLSRGLLPILDPRRYLFSVAKKVLAGYYRTAAKRKEREPELSRRVFLLFYGCDQSQKEIATSLGITEEAVRQRLYRTRSRIRDLLEHREQERS